MHTMCPSPFSNVLVPCTARTHAHHHLMIRIEVTQHCVACIYWRRSFLFFQLHLDRGTSVSDTNDMMKNTNEMETNT